MPSLFAWIDHSERQRRKVLDAIDMFHEKGTRDELGLGTIRDAFADLLFPGTGSLQTRARYFLFIPWMYKELEAKHVGPADIPRRSRQYEIKLIDVLAESGEPGGTIGISARAALRRLASNIYWTGLGVLSIRKFAGSQEEYHRFFDKVSFIGAATPRNDDGEPVSEIKHPWHAALPAPPTGFPHEVDFALSQHEAEYLRERVECSHPASLFAFLLRHLDCESKVQFAWFHHKFGELPPNLAGQVLHAKRFSEVMLGAALLYNLMIAEKPPRNDELIAAYESDLEQWALSIQAQLGDLRAWDRNGFWKVVHETDATRRPFTEGFVNSWIDLVLAGSKPRDVKTSVSARTLIEERERRLKRSLARLSNQRARELWRGASGTGQIDYRWRNAQWLMNDIFAGLQRG